MRKHSRKGNLRKEIYNLLPSNQNKCCQTNKKQMLSSGKMRKNDLLNPTSYKNSKAVKKL
jgi:hypothetical protein